MTGTGKVGNLFFGINLDSKEFKKGMRDVKRNMKKFQKDMKAGFLEVGKGAVALTGAITGLTTGAFALAKSTSELVNAQNILADSLGSTQSEIAGLELAADSMGVSYDMLIDKMREFGGVDEFKKLADEVRFAGDETKQLAEISNAIGDVGGVDEFKKLANEVKNAGNETQQLAKAQEIFGKGGAKLLPILQKDSAEFEKLSNDIKNAGDETKQLAKAQELFGNEGLKLLPILQQGSAGLNNYVEEAKKLGLALSPEDVTKMTSAWGEYEKAMQKITGLTRQFGLVFSEAFGEFSKKIGDLISDNMPKIVASVTVVWDAFKQWFNNMIMGFEVVLGAFGSLTDGISSEFGAIEVLVFALKNPFKTLLFALLKFTEKFLSIVSAPFRAILKAGGEFIGLILDMVSLYFSELAVIGSKMASILPEGMADKIGLSAMVDGLNVVGGAIDSVTDKIDAIGDGFDVENITGAFDGLLAPEFQDDFVSSFVESAKETKAEMEKVMGDITSKTRGEDKEGKKKTDTNDLSAEVSKPATLAIAGSIEAFKLENENNEIQQKQLSTLEKIAKNTKPTFMNTANLGGA